MKSLILLYSAILISIMASSQEPADALRYSWNVPAGTARIKAIGGAMGSLGGDITANFVNPAGLAFFKTGDFAFTPAYNFDNTKATYLTRTESDKSSNFMLGTSGFVIGSGGGKNNLRNVAFSIAVNRAADFNSNILYRGQNNRSSFSEKFVEELNNNGVRTSQQAENDYPLGSSLVYNTHWIDSISSAPGQIAGFRTNAPVSTGLNQQQTINSNGGVTEISVGLAANMKDRVMFGGAIGIPILKYKRQSEFLEADATDNKSNAFDYGIFSENLETSGAGINLKLGLIFRPTELFRLGLAFHSPTFYSLTDNYAAEVTLNYDVPDNLAWHDKTSNYISAPTSEFKYQLTTPLKLIGSVSYVLREVEDVTKQRGFLTADVEYVNYGGSSFTADDENYNDQSTIDYLSSLTRAVGKAYKGSFNFRAGGELKFTTVMVRLGAAYYGNPYNNIHGEKGSKLDLSAGLGYRNQGFFIDLAYVHSMQKDVHYAYRLENSPYFGADLKGRRGNALLTVGLKF